MIKSVKGTRDILPAAYTDDPGEQSHLWQFVEDKAREVFGLYGFEEIRTPIFEKTELFARGVGESTDIVNKEMYTWTDRAAEGRTGESLTLRPENTASVIRSYIEHQMWTKRNLVKLYYIGPQFRRERPQKGRFRQFYQIGAEVIGNTDNPAIEAEVIEMLDKFLKSLGIVNTTLLVNSVGCPGCRPKFNEALKAALAADIDKMCGDCQRRYEINPLRVLDCKVPADQPYIDALPAMLDMLCDECRTHFEMFRSFLDARGIAYTISKRMVRGLDYYVKTAFEIIGGNLGAQNSILGGGRYDGLSETLGGPKSSGFGFAIGFDRLVMSLPADSPVRPPAPDYFIAWLGEEALQRAVLLARDLRNAGLNIAVDFEGRKLKASMREADKLGARRVIIIGEDELRSGSYIVRDMSDGSQKSVAADQAVNLLR